jgi:hypothetical protein
MWLEEERPKKKASTSEVDAGDLLYSPSLLMKTVEVNVNEINEKVLSLVQKKMAFLLENKCIEEGFIQPKSIEIVDLSACKIVKGNVGQFLVSFHCKVCFPVEGMRISCRVTGITSAVIQAESSEETPSPILVFISCELDYPSFAQLTIGDIVLIEVIGQRFSLNDSYIEITGKIVSR